MREWLDVEGLTVRLGGSLVLSQLSLSVSQGKTITILGRNGVGKTTLLRTIMGLNGEIVEGGMRFLGEEVSALPPEARARKGISYVPQGRQIFSSLSVEANLKVAERVGPLGEKEWCLEQIYEIFPVLAEKRGMPGASLSGGQQQLLAIARALISNPYLLLMDEPTEGLAPIMVKKVAETLCLLKEKGIAILLVEQNAAFGLQLADEVYIMHRGSFVYRGDPEEIDHASDIKRQYLGVS